MPIMFEYKCCKCGEHFEELVFSQDEIPACPKCGHGKTEKLLSACRHKTGGASPDLGTASSTSSSSACSSCSGGNCSTCGG